MADLYAKLRPGQEDEKKVYFGQFDGRWSKEGEYGWPSDGWPTCWEPAMAEGEKGKGKERHCCCATEYDAGENPTKAIESGRRGKWLEGGSCKMKEECKDEQKQCYHMMWWDEREARVMLAREIAQEIQEMMIQARAEYVTYSANRCKFMAGDRSTVDVFLEKFYPQTEYKKKLLAQRSTEWCEDEACWQTEWCKLLEADHWCNIKGGVCLNKNGEKIGCKRECQN